jgi:transposase
MTRTPRRHLLKFRVTIFKGAARTEDLIFHLTELHYYDGGKKVLVLWDHLPGHHGADTYFSERHRGWFEFEYFPTHSPELNSVESCWNRMKNEYLPNFVPISDEELVSEVYAVAMKINEEKKIDSCFNTAGIEP